MTFTVGEFISIFGLITTVGIFAAGVIWNLWKKVIENATHIADFRLEVAEKYVNSQRLIDMEQKMLLGEERLHDSLENLSSRIDRLLERIERK